MKQWMLRITSYAQRLLDDLAGLGAQLELPKGWSYAARVLDQELAAVAKGEFVSIELSGVESKQGPYVLTDAGGTGLLAVGDPHLSVSAWPYTMEDLEAATHIHELPSRDSITLNLDHRVSGVGGTANSVLNPSRVLPGEYAFTFTIKPVI